MVKNLTVHEENMLRRRVLGVHVPDPKTDTRLGFSSPKTDLDPASLRRKLAALNIHRGEVVEVQRFVSRRLVVLASYADNSALVVKWPHREVALRSDNEEFWLARLAELAAVEPLRSSFPRLLSSGDPEEGAIVLDAMTECQPLSEIIADGTGPSTEWWVRFAVALGMLHQLEVPNDVRNDPNRQRVLPLPASFHLTTEEYALGCGSDFAHYVSSLQEVSDELAQLRLCWRTSALIHFDLTGANVLVSNSSDATPVRIVDWELAGMGDPMYDVGSLLNHLLGNALRSVPLRTSEVGASDTWSAMLRHSRHFLTVYQDITGVDADELMRAARYVGLFQFLYALGRLERIGSLGKIGNMSLLIGQRVLRRPELVTDMLLNRSH